VKKTPQIYQITQKLLHKYAGWEDFANFLIEAYNIWGYLGIFRDSILLAFELENELAFELSNI
jgi:hypothetical protein